MRTGGQRSRLRKHLPLMTGFLGRRRRTNPEWPSRAAVSGLRASGTGVHGPVGVGACSRMALALVRNVEPGRVGSCGRGAANVESSSMREGGRFPCTTEDGPSDYQQSVFAI